MDHPVRRFAAAIVLPDIVARPLTALRQKYDLPPWEPRIPLHITLVSPFTTHATIDGLSALWVPVAAAARQFRVILDGIGRFDNEESAVFARVIPNIELSELADAALAAVAHLCSPRSHPFTPHITLAAPASRAVVDGWIEVLSRESLSMEFICDRFSLLRLDENPREWCIVREFPFG